MMRAAAEPSQAPSGTGWAVTTQPRASRAPSPPVTAAGWPAGPAVVERPGSKAGSGLTVTTGPPEAVTTRATRWAVAVRASSWPRAPGSRSARTTPTTSPLSPVSGIANPSRGSPSGVVEAGSTTSPSYTASCHQPSSPWTRSPPAPAAATVNPPASVTTAEVTTGSAATASARNRSVAGLTARLPVAR
ncbi:MAG: hypothetical protein ACK5RL_07875 [Acidimicrobiales bacterium]